MATTWTDQNDIDVTDDRAAELGAAVRIGSYSDYADAQRAVDALSDDGFPVQHLQIVASGLSLVEQVTGRLTTWGAAGRGAGSGAVFGAVIGALLGSFTFVDPLVTMWITAFWGLLAGALIGGIAGAVAHAMTRGRRDFDTVGGIRAERYDVLAAQDVAADAQRRLHAAV